MKIIEVNPLENGSHHNQEIYGVCPDVFPVPKGWAVIPERMEIPETFPFVSISATEVDGVMTVTSMTAGVIPDSVLNPEPSAEERIAALENALCEQDSANSQRMSEIENALCEMDRAAKGGS